MQKQSGIDNFIKPNRRRSLTSSEKPVIPNKICKADIGDNNDLETTNEDKSFTSKEMDDKGVADLSHQANYLIDLISKYLNNESLKCLLNEKEQVLLGKCKQIKNPEMFLVSWLFWNKMGWYRKDKVRSILLGGKKNEKKTEDSDDPTSILVLNSLKHNDLIEMDRLNECDQFQMTLDDYVNVLDISEVNEILKSFNIGLNNKKINKSQNKPEIIKLEIIEKKKNAVIALERYINRKSIKDYIESNNNNSQRVLEKLSEKAGLFRLTDLARKTIYKLYVLMHLGINYNSLKSTIKRSKKEEPIDNCIVTHNASVVFKTNEEFERYIKALELKENKATAVADVFQIIKDYKDAEMQRFQLLPTWLLQFTPFAVYVKILLDKIKELKKNKEYQTVLDILSAVISQNNKYRLNHEAGWYNEKALVLRKMGRYDDAASILLDGLKSNLSEEGKFTLRLQAAITAKLVKNQLNTELLEYAEDKKELQSKIPAVNVQKLPMDRLKLRSKPKYEQKTPSGSIEQKVEACAISHYLNNKEFTHAKHFEDKIVTTAFFLLFWDIIYSNPPDCPGIFLTPFQVYPLDMMYDSFYANRKDAIENRLKELKSMEIDTILHKMQEIWKSKFDYALQRLLPPIRALDKIDYEDVRAVSLGMGAPAITAVCARLARSYRHARNGFPDLTLWNENTKKIRFVEVKSDTDYPSEKQLQWMHYLLENDIDTGFCNVGDHTKKNKARANA